MHWEEEDTPHATRLDELAIRAWNLLHNGMNGLDWSGLPVVAEYLGVEDVEDLIDRLSVIKRHEPPRLNQDR